METMMLSLHGLSFDFGFLDFTIIYFLVHIRLDFTCGPVTDVTEFSNLTMAVYI